MEMQIRSKIFLTSMYTVIKALGLYGDGRFWLSLRSDNDNELVQTTNEFSLSK